MDIATDGYAVETLPRAQHGWGNAAQVGGAYLGSAIGGGLFLVFVSGLGWQLGVWLMVGLIVLLGLPFVTRLSFPAAERSHTPSLKFALARPEIRRGLLVAAIFVIVPLIVIVVIIVGIRIFISLLAFLPLVHLLEAALDYCLCKHCRTTKQFLSNVWILKGLILVVWRFWNSD